MGTSVHGIKSDCYTFCPSWIFHFRFFSSKYMPKQKKTKAAPPITPPAVVGGEKCKDDDDGDVVVVVVLLEEDVGESIATLLLYIYGSNII